MQSINTTEKWIDLTQQEQLKEAIAHSFDEPVVLFKHSTTCGISAGANHHLEQNWNNITHDVTFYYLDLLKYRSISNLIASELGVIHQSPQVILLKNGKAVYSTSHHAINVAKLNDAIASA